MMIVADSSALIPLARAGKLEILKEIFGTAVTPESIYQETVQNAKGKLATSEIEEAYGDWIERVEVESEEAKSIGELNGIDSADAEVLLLAEDRDEIILANDKALIRVARSRDIECYWPTTLVLKAVKQEKFSKDEAKEAVYRLVDSGMNLSPQIYTQIMKKIDNIG